MADDKKPKRPKPPAPDPDDLRRDSIVEADQVRKQEQKDRHQQIHMDMMRSIVTEPLLSNVQAADPGTKFDVIISLNELFQGGMAAALEQVRKRADEWGVRYATVSHYVFACLTREQIMALAGEIRDLMAKGPAASPVYRVWEDSEVTASLTNSLVTVKADAAQRAFQAQGEGIVWAVMDSGIQGTHPHFQATPTAFGPINNLQLTDPLGHKGYTPINPDPLVDEFGHGTHVAGIIAGAWQSADPQGDDVAGIEIRNEQTNDPIPQRSKLRTISGVAPRCRLVSLKVIADRTAVECDAKQTAGSGKVSWVLQAIDQVQQWNQYGKRLLVHGVNMSLGYDFDPRWFACGQSPICVEVNRLVKCGVMVVVSAGNAGFGSVINAAGKAEARYSDLTITDPGNADLAITVGSTHRDMPHLYGVSYFSSRGPTGDGRMKPDLVAPGERIVSCAAGAQAAKFGTAPDPAGKDQPVLYCEQTGTSMAAPHVSGAVAAFLSVRREFIGQPERVKEIFMQNTVDLRREPKFQGTGLLDLMKVLQAV